MKVSIFLLVPLVPPGIYWKISNCAAAASAVDSPDFCLHHILFSKFTISSTIWKICFAQGNQLAIGCNKKTDGLVTFSCTYTLFRVPDSNTHRFFHFSKPLILIANRALLLTVFANVFKPGGLKNGTQISSVTKLETEERRISCSNFILISFNWQIFQADV